MAYVSGNPILNDEEYDQLKLKLKVSISFMLHSKQTSPDKITLNFNFMILSASYRWMVVKLCARVQDAVSVVKR